MGRLDREAMEKKIAEGEARERKENKKKMKEKFKKEKISFWSDFKAFITKGNVLDMAVAVVVSTAFNAIVNGLVKNIITPCITYLTSGVSINEWEWVLREEVLNAEGVVEISKISVQYGLWLQAIVDFLIIAFSVFVVVRVIKSTERKMNAKELAKKAEEEAKKKAEADAAAAKAKEEADAAAAAAAAEAAAKQKALDEYYANAKEQSELLRKLLAEVSKK